MTDSTDNAYENPLDDDDDDEDEFDDEERPRDPLAVLADFDSDSKEGQLEWREEVARQIHSMNGRLGEHTLAIQSLTNWLQAVGVLVAFMLLYLIAR